MDRELEHIRVTDYSFAKKKKRRTARNIRTVFFILIFLLFVSTIIFFIISGRDTIDITEGADSAYVPIPSAEQTESPQEESELLEDIQTPAPVPTAAPTPTPTMTPINNNPKNGSILQRMYSDQVCRLTVSNALKTDCCIIAEHIKTETNAVIAFVRAGETCDIMIPNGTYNFIAKSGENYLSTDTFFGPDTKTYVLAESVVLPWGESYSVFMAEDSDR